MLKVEHIGVVKIDNGVEMVEVVQEGTAYLNEFWSIYVEVHGLAMHIADRDTFEEIIEFKEALIDSVEDDLALRSLWKENDERLKEEDED